MESEISPSSEFIDRNGEEYFQTTFETAIFREGEEYGYLVLDVIPLHLK